MNLPDEFTEVLSASKSDGRLSSENSPFKAKKAELDKELDEVKASLQ